MKKILTLAVILLTVTVTSFAAAPPRPNYGKVSIKSRSNEMIQVVIDGKQYSMNRNGFVLDNLRPGRHSIQIYKIDNNGMWRKRPQLIYNSTMNVKPWELVDININRNERVSVSSRIDPSDRRDGRYDRDYDRDGRYNDRDGRPGRY